MPYYCFLKTITIKNYTMRNQIAISNSISILNFFIKFCKKFEINILLVFTFGLFSNSTSAQLTLENFNNGIPASWAITSNQTVTSNWQATSATGGYQNTPGVSVNPSTNNTVGLRAEYFFISPQFNTPPPASEIRFLTKQGSFTNRGTTYEVRLSTADQPDMDSFNVVLASWTEAQLNVSATTFEEKIITIPSLPQGIPVYIAFVAITNQTGTTNTSGDTWFVDNIRVITSCAPVTGINSTMSANSGLINWSHPTATNFEIQVVPQGSGVAATGTAVNGFSHNATGLIDGTNYDVYIKTVCDATTASRWAGPFPVTTSRLGLGCATPVIIPNTVTTTPYVLSTNLNTFYNNQNYTPLDSRPLSCQPTGATFNYLMGDHAFLSYTPTQNGLINISQVVEVNSANNCYNASSGVFIFDACPTLSQSNCLGGMVTGVVSGVNSASINNFFVQAGQTYYFVISSPYQYYPDRPGAGVCFTFSISAPTCPIPSGLNYENLTHNGATFSWGNPQNLVSNWEYVVKLAANGLPTTSDVVTASNTNTNVNVSGLIPNTKYNLYVRSVCNGTPGQWSAAMLFRTQCVTFTPPYFTDFTGATDDESQCWTSLDLNRDGRFFGYAGAPDSPPVQARLVRLRTIDSGNQTNDMLVSPRFNFDGVSQKQIRFKYKGFGGYTNSTGYVLGESSFMMKLSTTGIGPNNFTRELLPIATYQTGNNYIEMIVVVPADVIGDVNIAWYLPPGHVNTSTNFFIDDVYVENLPACSPPSYPGVTAGSITQTSAQFYWTNGYNNSQWEIVVQPLNSGVPTVNGELVGTNPFIKTGLTPSTRYEYYIRTYCNSTEKSVWVGPVPFNTLCDAQPVPYFESLNTTDVTTKKFCWSVINRNNDNNSLWRIEDTEASISGRDLFMTPFSSYDDFLVSAQVNVVGQKMLKYKYKVASNIFNPVERGNFEVIMSSTPDFSTYTVLIPAQDFNNIEYRENFVIFNGTGPAYFAFHLPPNMENPRNTGLVFIDDFSIEDAPLCPNPSNLLVSNIGVNSATLSWTRGFSETQWEVVIQNPSLGIPSGSGTLVNTSPTYNATALTENTMYEYYVRAVCGSNGNSEWIGPFEFKTICNPIQTPFIETFDSSSTTESCWTVIDNNQNSNFWGTNQPANPIFGDQMAAIFSGTNGNNDDWLISPTLMVRPNQRLRFYYKTLSSGFEEDLKIKISTNGTDLNQFTTILYENNYLTSTSTGTTIGSNIITVDNAQGARVGDRVWIPGWPLPYPTNVASIAGNTITLTNAATLTLAGPLSVEFIHEVINNTTPREMVINLSGITAPTNINLAFHIPFYPPNAWNYRGQFLFIDNVIVEDIPVCPPVYNVAINTNTITDTVAEINWDSAGSETSWEISVQPYGTAAPTGNTLPQYLHTATSHPYTITGLTPSTRYQIYVRAICSGTNQSVWSGPFELLTKCDLTNICQYTITLDNGTTGRVTERLNVMQNNQLVQALTFPNNTTPLDYQVYLCRGMEFSLYWQGQGSGLQYSNAQVTIKDYQGNIIWTSPRGLGTINTTIFSGISNCGAVTCPQPTNLTVNNQGVLSWTPGGSETQWEVFIQPLGLGALPQSGVIVNSTSYTPQTSDFLNPLAGTNEFFVRAVCGATDRSYWSGPKIFIRNDESTTAIVLPINTGGTCANLGTKASFLGATVSSEASSCGGLNGGDIWYQFTATSKVHTIELSNFGPGSYYASAFNGAWPRTIITLYEVQSNGSLVQKACSENHSITTEYSSECLVGSTYKIRIAYNGSTYNDKKFDICVSTPVDLCERNAFNYSLEKLPMQYVTGITQIIDATVVPGWRVNTDTGTIFFQEEGNSPGVIPYEGGQCVQLIHDNANTWNASSNNIKGLYKDFDTSEILKMKYSFASASRIVSAGGTTLELWAGPPSGPFTQITEHNSSTLVWRLIEGIYNVPAGQTTTRFIFRVKNYAIGHLLDAANFTPVTNIETQNTTISCNQSVNVVANGIGQWIADTSNPVETIIQNPNSTTTSISGFNTPGVYIYHWKTRYCDETLTITYNGFNEVPTVTSPVQYCKSDVATALSASAPSGYTTEWYTASIGGIGNANSPIPSTTIVGSTTYYVALVNAQGCAGSRVPLNVIINDLTIPVVGFTYNSTSFCKSEANPVLTLASEFTTGGTYSATPTGLSINSNNGAINLATSNAGTYVITYTLAREGCRLGDTSSFTIDVTEEVTYELVSICESQEMFLKVNATGNSDLTNVDYSWENENGNVIGTNSPTFNVNNYLAQNSNISLPTLINVTVSKGGCTSSKSFTITANECSLIPRGISPNGDGDNDTFDLTGLGAKQISIFNRYGSEIYSFNGTYTNQWDGKDKDGSQLPDGTYFYSITFQDGKSVTGWVYIIRQY